MRSGGRPSLRTCRRPRDLRPAGRSDRWNQAVLRRCILLFVLPLALLLVWGCSTRTGGGSGPMISPTGIVYAPGVPPTETRYSQTATLYLRQGRVERALDLALQGVEADAENPIHYFLAGVAHARLRQYDDAHRMFSEAERIYPAYELEIEPQRERAWAEAFNEGAETYDRGEVEATVEAWGSAIRIYERRPEVHRNLASLLAGEGRAAEAIEVYRRGLEGLERGPASRVLEEDERVRRERQRVEMEERLGELLLLEERYVEAEPLLRRRLARDSTNVQARSDLAAALSGQGKGGEAAELYASLLSESSLEATQLFNLGVALFRQGRNQRAAEAFRRLTRIQPDSRDAWFNYANTLFAAEDWETLVSVGDRVLALDPLNENTRLIVARARLETGDEPGALRDLERMDAVPLFVEGLQMGPSGGGTLIQGTAVGSGGEPGSDVPVRFTFYGEDGRIGSQIVSIPVPPEGERESFRLTFSRRASSYRYEVMP